MMTLIRTPTWGKHQEIRRIEATPELLEKIARWNGGSVKETWQALVDGHTIHTSFATWRKA